MLTTTTLTATWTGRLRGRLIRVITNWWRRRERSSSEDLLRKTMSLLNFLKSK